MSSTNIKNTHVVTLTLRNLKNDDDTLFVKDMPLDDFVFVPIGQSRTGSGTFIHKNSRVTKIIHVAGAIQTSVTKYSDSDNVPSNYASISFTSILNKINIFSRSTKTISERKKFV